MSNEHPGPIVTLAAQLGPPAAGMRLPGPEIRPPRFDRTPPRRGLIAIGFVAAVWAAMATSPFRSVGVWIALSSLVIAASFSVARDRRARWLSAGALALLPWLAVRHSPWLIGVDVAVAAALLATAASVRPGRRIGVRFSDLVSGWLSSLWAAGFGPRVAAADIGAALSGVDVSRHRVVALGRAVAVAVSVCAVAIVLLASGDALFASFLDLGSIWETVAGRVGAALLGVALCVLIFGSFRSLESPVRTFPSLQPATLLVTMFGLSATIGVYGVVQVVAVASGADYVERRTGLTYAEYARGGFFQLVAVVAITVLVLAAVRSTRLLRPASSHVITRLAGVLTLAVLSLVATSVVKLVIYADRYGLTMLRVYTITFAVWLGFVAVATFAALVHGSDRWLTPVVLLSVVVGAFVMNVADPERFVAQHNIERARGGAELDVDYLGRLSDDALPTILAGFDELGFDEELEPESRWCRRVDVDSGPFDRNAAVTGATRARRAHCTAR